MDEPDGELREILRRVDSKLNIILTLGGLFALVVWATVMAIAWEMGLGPIFIGGLFVAAIFGLWDWWRRHK